MEKQIIIEQTEIEGSIKKVGKSFNAIHFKELLEKFESKIDIAKKMSDELRVRSEATETKSIEIASTAKKLDAVIQKAKLSAKRPYLDFIQTLDTMVGPLQKALKSIQANEKKKCTAYRTELLRKQREAEKVQEMPKIELGGLNTTITKPIKQAAGKVETVAAGSANYRTTFKAELVDITKVPAKYLLVDWKMVNSDVKDGIRSIPGFDIKESIDMTLKK
jgi:hypothetical protein